MVLAALSVPVGLNEPQVLAGVQLHFTPTFAGSLLTVAAMLAVPLGTFVVLGGVVKLTEITVTSIVIAGVLALFVESVTVVAVITTLLVGTMVGAV